MSVNVNRTYSFSDASTFTPATIEAEVNNIVDTLNAANGGLLSWDKVCWTVRAFTATGSITASVETLLAVKKSVGAATAVTLPASPVTGSVYIVKDSKGDANTNNITITPASGTIDGAANKVISTSYGVQRFFYNGTEWNTW